MTVGAEDEFANIIIIQNMNSNMLVSVIGLLIVFRI